MLAIQGQRVTSGERSGRVTSRMDAETRLVHARLSAWGTWAKENRRAWAERTWLGKLIDGEISRADHVQPVSMPDHIATVDAAVCALPRDDRDIIESYYLQWDAMEVCARRVGLSVDQFKTGLKCARLRVAGFLAARES